MTRLTTFPRTRRISNLQHEVNDLFEELLPARFKQEDDDRRETAVWSPRADIAEAEDAYFISVDLPGVLKDDVEVTVDNNVLKISGQREIDRENGSDKYTRIERAYGRFFRSFNLGKEIAPGRIEAKHKNGVLTIRLPKTEESKPRQIEIR